MNHIASFGLVLRMYALWATAALLCLGNSLMAQPTGDSVVVEQARGQAVRAYEQRLKPQAHVYEGNQYVGLDPRIKEHPYFRVDSLQRGTVVLAGASYPDVQLLYDIVRDQLAIQPMGGAYRLRVPMSNVSAFTLGDHPFVRITGDSLATVRPGFYEIIYNGRVRVLAKRGKTIQEDLSGGYFKADYLPKDPFVVQKGNGYYSVKSKQDLLRLFPDQAKELRRYMRQNDLRFKETTREEAIIQTTKRYDELTPAP